MAIRTADELFRDFRKRLTLVERRLALVSGKWKAPERLAAVATAILDANLAVASGKYWLSSGALNKPTNGTHWELNVLAIGTGSVYQEAKLIGAGYYRERWIRAFTSGSWSGWSLVDKGTTTFTPSFNTGIVFGNGTASGRYEIMNGYLRGRMFFTLGSTSSMLNSDVIMDYPVPVSADLGVTNFDGSGRLVVAGGNYDAAVIMNSSGIYVRAKRVGNAGAEDFIAQHTITSTTPAAWGASSRIEIAFGYPVSTGNFTP